MSASVRRLQMSFPGLGKLLSIPSLLGVKSTVFDVIDAAVFEMIMFLFLF